MLAFDGHAMIAALTRRTALAAAGGFALPALAQPRWPTRTVRLIVPFAPGGPVEPPARMIAESLAPRLGQPVVVELKPGAAGAIGVREVAHATDGHTFLVMTGGLAVLPALQRDPGFDLFRDIAPISFLGETPMAIVVRADSPIRDAADLIDRARRAPQTIAYGSSGNGSTTHLAWLLIQARADVEFLHVPYRGAGQAINAVYTGEIATYMGDLGLLLPHIQDGRFRLIAMTSRDPVPLMPDAPRLASVVPGYDMTIWYCMAGPRSTPPDVIQLLLREMAPLRDGSALAQRFAAGGGRVVLSDPAVLAERLREEAALWRGVLERAGIRPE